MTLNPARKGQTVPKIESWFTFAFPKIPERIFNVASPYSMPVTVNEQLEIGFRFVEGYTFFHLYSNGTTEENNTINIDEVAGRLGDDIDSKLATYLPS